MRKSNLTFTFLAAILFPVLGQSAGYTFTSFQYPNTGLSVFTGIDDAGRISGFSQDGFGTFGFFITGAGSLSTVKLPGYQFSVPYAISAKAGLVGTARDPNTGLFYMFQDNVNGFNIVPANLVNQTVNGINSSFNTVGNFTPSTAPNAVYAKIRGTYYTLLPTSHCSYTIDPAINDYSVVVGGCMTPNNTTIGFVWTRGRYTYFQPPAGSASIHPNAINNSGVIAGWYLDTSGLSHGFVLNGSTFTTVDYSSAGASNTQIWGMNSAGKIVGSYVVAQVTVAFSATPK